MPPCPGSSDNILPATAVRNSSTHRCSRFSSAALLKENYETHFAPESALEILPSSGVNLVVLSESAIWCWFFSDGLPDTCMATWQPL
jgi:hypothetical protein